MKMNRTLRAAFLCVLMLWGGIAPGPQIQPAQAQSTQLLSLLPMPRVRNGSTLALAKLYFYVAGTTTPLDTYSDADGAVGHKNTNPVIADSAGLFGPIYILPRTYKVVLKTSANVIVFTQDYVQGANFNPGNVINIDDWPFNAAGDGVTDDLVPLTNFINTLNANPGTLGVMGNHIYATSAALPAITSSFVRIQGSGPAGIHDAGAAEIGTVIKKIGSAGGTVFSVAPIEGASAQYLTGLDIGNVTVNCNGLAAKCISIKSVRYSNFNMQAYESTAIGMELGVVTTLGEARDLQYNTINFVGRQAYYSGTSMVLTGDANANVSHNWFQQVDITQKDGIGVDNINVDHNLWEKLRVFSITGAATNSVVWRGGATGTQTARDEMVIFMTVGLPAIAKGTGTYTYAATDIRVFTLDTSAPGNTITVETGASAVWWRDDDGIWKSYTPTITSGTGTITTKSATGRYRHNGPNLEIQMTITITTNGTGAGYIKATLPLAAQYQQLSFLNGAETALTSKGVYGTVQAGDTFTTIKFYDGSYPGANGAAVSVSGYYQIYTTQN